VLQVSVVGGRQGGFVRHGLLSLPIAEGGAERGRYRRIARSDFGRLSKSGTVFMPDAGNHQSIHGYLDSHFESATPGPRSAVEGMKITAFRSRAARTFSTASTVTVSSAASILTMICLLTPASWANSSWLAPVSVRAALINFMRERIVSITGARPNPSPVVNNATGKQDS